MARKYNEGDITAAFEIIKFIKSEWYVVMCIHCGEIKNSRVDRINKSKSCGCLKTGINHRSYKHGLDDKHPIYFMWHDMKTRCYNPKSDRYNSYGLRGITVCPEWINNYKLFYEWSISNGWSNGLQIDRIDNDGNYCPENCRFVTNKVNSRKRSNTIWIDINGEKMCLSEACERYGLSVSVYKSIHREYKKGLNLRG